MPNKRKSTKQSIRGVASVARAAAPFVPYVPESATKALITAAEKAALRAVKKDQSKQRTMSIKGSGDYIVNSLVKGHEVDLGAGANGPAHISSTDGDGGSTIIRRREYCMDILSPTSPSDFYNRVFSINAGLSQLFVWLSQLSTNYTSYSFEQLLFEFVPTVSDASLSGVMGNLMLAVDYNAANAPFTTKRELMEYHAALSGKPCNQFLYGVEVDRKYLMGNEFFIRAGEIPTGQDIKTYDIGTLQVATSGLPPLIFPPGVQLGELWVHYKVRLNKPRLYDGLGYAIPSDAFVSTVDCTALQPLGSAPLKSANNSIGGTFDVTSSTYSFPANFTGYVEVILHAMGNPSGSHVIPNPTVIKTGYIDNVDDLQLGGPGSTSYYTYASGKDSTPPYDSSVSVYHFNITRQNYSGNNSLQFTFSDYPASLGSWLLVRQYNHLIGSMTGSSSSFIPV